MAPVQLHSKGGQDYLQENSYELASFYFYFYLFVCFLLTRSIYRRSLLLMHSFFISTLYTLCNIIIQHTSLFLDALLDFLKQKLRVKLIESNVYIRFYQVEGANLEII